MMSTAEPLLKLLVVTPTFDGGVRNTEAIINLYQLPPHPKLVAYRKYQSPLITLNRNQAWADALNLRGAGMVTHLLMIDADVCPVEEDWFDKLWKEFVRTGAKVMGAVVPIKDDSGETSTAVWEDRWKARRYSLDEVAAKEPSWTEGGLLVATGCLLVDVRGTWADQIRFSIQDRIIKVGGKREADFIPEDWGFCLYCHTLGIDVWATRVVKLVHWDGRTAYPNFREGK